MADPDSKVKILDGMLSAFQTIAPALAGGVVRYLRSMSDSKFNLKKLAIELPTACFAGWVVLSICSDMHVSPRFSGAIAGVTGYLGGEGIDWVAARLMMYGDRFLERWLGRRK